MVRGPGPLWPFGLPARQVSPAHQAGCSMTAICSATSPTATMALNRSCGWSIARRREIRRFRRHRRILHRAVCRGVFIILATTSQSSCSKWCACLRKRSGKKPNASCCPCSPAMCRQLTPTSTIWCATSVSGRRRRLARGSHASSSGTGRIIAIRPVVPLGLVHQCVGSPRQTSYIPPTTQGQKNDECSNVGKAEGQTFHRWCRQGPDRRDGQTAVDNRLHHQSISAQEGGRERLRSLCARSCGGGAGSAHFI